MDKFELIKKPVAQELEKFKTLFDSSLSSETPLLNEALKYIKKRNGKMMRPILVLLMAKLFGTSNEATQHVAIALELLHTASLVHDDVVDESDKRRGQRSVNAVFDNKISILVGDYMLATSLKHAAWSGNVALVELVARLGQELAEGEIIQLSNTSNESFSEGVYFEVIRKKTAALFVASAESGALSVDASKEQIATSALYGQLIGTAFQIKDDIFDYFSNPDLGKPTGNDMVEGKLTLPALYVLNKLKDETLNQVALRIRALEATPEEIADFVEVVKREGGIEYAEKVMYDYRNQAMNVLPKNIDPALYDALAAYIDFVIERKI